jgi:hypothetical protein
VALPGIARWPYDSPTVSVYNRGLAERVRSLWSASRWNGVKDALWMLTSGHPCS